MHIDYRSHITEEAEALLALEQSLRGHVRQVRVHLLRLFKTEQVRTIQEAAPLIGYSTKQLQRWWQLYREHGLSALTEIKPKGGSKGKLTETAWLGLEAQMKAGKIARLEDARRYLRQEHEIDYGSLNGVWQQMNKRGARLKTGRRRHQLSDEAAQAAFKKSVRLEPPGVVESATDDFSRSERK